MCALFLFNLHLDAKAASLGLTLCPLSKPGFKACLYRCEIQEMLHPRNWCLCRWNSSIVTISVKWQQCSPDHCLRDDILLNSISFLIISSCSIHHLSLFSLWCTPLLLSPSVCPKYPPCLTSVIFFIWSHVCFHSMWDMPSIWALINKISSDILMLYQNVNDISHLSLLDVNTWYWMRQTFLSYCMYTYLYMGPVWRPLPAQMGMNPPITCNYL